MLRGHSLDQGGMLVTGVLGIQLRGRRNPKGPTEKQRESKGVQRIQQRDRGNPKDLTEEQREPKGIPRI